MHYNILFIFAKKILIAVKLANYYITQFKLTLNPLSLYKVTIMALQNFILVEPKASAFWCCIV